MSKPTELEIELARRFDIVTLTPIHLAFIHGTKDVAPFHTWMLGQEAIFKGINFIGLANEYPHMVEAIRTAAHYLADKQAGCTIPVSTETPPRATGVEKEEA